MSDTPYLTTPVDSEKLPGGISYIVGNEAAERFSFYGMKTILFVFMTKYLVDQAGQPDLMTTEQATVYVHSFGMWTYLFPIVGGFLADAFFGKYRTILALSIVYCLGHLTLAWDETRTGLGLGLMLIAIGAGGIKPCVSAHVGDQFGTKNQFLLPRVFSWFYFSINFGSLFSTLMTPKLLEWYGPHVAFGVPGGLMLLATWVFWLGRRKFVHIPPRGIGFFKRALSGDSGKSLLSLSIIFGFVAMFWCLFDQTSSRWVDQATRMDRIFDLSFLGRSGTLELTPSQIQAANPALVLVLIPIFAYGLYPVINKVFPLTALRKISMGLFITVLAFAISAWIEMDLVAGKTPHIMWQVGAYLILTAAEVMVSITTLEFAYTQAPSEAKSLVMSLYLLSVSVGNEVTVLVNQFIQNEDGGSKLPGADYYWFFTGVMFATAVLFIFVAKWYRVRPYLPKAESVHIIETAEPSQRD